MYKLGHRKRRGHRKHIKRGLTMCFCCVVIFLVAFNFYDTCLEIFPSLSSYQSQCKQEAKQTAIERLNVSSILEQNIPGVDIISKLDRLLGPTVVPHQGVMDSAIQNPNRFLQKEVQSFTEFPLHEMFEERQIKAENQCKDIVNAAREKAEAAARLETTTSSITDLTKNFEFSVGYPGFIFKKKKKIPMFDANEIEFQKLNEQKLNALKQYYLHPNIFETLVKKNRWIHFHRIVESPDGPAHNKVVEINWCPIFKAASTPWLAVFTKLSKALTNKTEAQIQRGKLGFMELAKTYRLLTPTIYDKAVHPIKYNMVVVRHPFKRLLSGYRDKIERVKGRLYYYNKYSTSILAKFRKSNLGSLERKTKDKDFSLKVPTFQEFVQFVLSVQPRKLDEHWRPIYMDCNPCLKKFDFVLKVETLNVDKDNVLKYLHLSSSDPLYKEIENVWLRWNNPSGTSLKRNESYYYSQLSVLEIEKLYKLYEIDFTVFDYSPDAYYLMGTDE